MVMQITTLLQRLSSLKTKNLNDFFLILQKYNFDSNAVEVRSMKYANI